MAVMEPQNVTENLSESLYEMAGKIRGYDEQALSCFAFGYH